MTDPAAAAPSAPLARSARRTLEPAHAFIYFAPEAARRYQEIGLKGGYMSYFAPRAAPLGAASADLVIATFYNFSPRVVRRAIPAAWELASPEQVLAARYAAAEEVLAPLAAGADGLDEAVELLRLASADLDPAGRPLFAGHASLPWPQGPAHLELWHGLTLLREYRGDGHIAALLTHGVGPVAALVLHAASGGPSAEVLQTSRGWQAEEWQAGVEDLTARGLLDAGGQLTPEGAALRERIEQRTDELDAVPWTRLGPERTERLRTLVRPLSAQLAELSAAMHPAKS